MSNFNLETQGSGVSASEASNPRVLDISESDSWVHVDSEGYKSDLGNVESADFAAGILNAEDSVAKRPSRRHCLCDKASKCRSVRKGAANRRRSRRRATKRKQANHSSSSAGGSQTDNAELDNPGLENPELEIPQLDNPENGELNIREFDVSGIHIPRLDINGRVIPHDPEIDGPQHQGPLIDNTGSELPGHPERQVSINVEASRRNNAPVQINGQRFAIRLEPEADGAQNRNDAAPDNRAGPVQAEPSWLVRKWLLFRHFVIDELPTWPFDWQFPVYAVITFIYILLCEFVMFMVVILSVGALNIMLQMRSGPRAVSQQILKDIPFAYLRHIPILFSCSVVVDGFTVFHLGPPEEHGLRRFPMLYLHRQSARLCVSVANRLLDLYTVISVVNCALLGYKLLSAN